MIKKILLLVFITLTTLFLGVSCSKKLDTGQNPDTNGETTTVFAVSTTLAVEGEIKDYLQLNGDIRSSTTVDTYPDTAGKLKKLYVEVGDTVRKNQIIAEIDPSKPGMNFAASPVKASISGTVTMVPVQIGYTISPNFPIAVISRMDDLEVIIYVAERFISKMQIGLPAVIHTEAFPGEIFRGTISELSPVVDQISRTMEVKLKIDNRDRKLKAGMFTEVKLITEEKEGIVKIPASALINRFGETYIFTIEKDPESENRSMVRKKVVVPGLKIDNQLEIMEGITAGEEIVVRGQTLLEDRSLVKVVSTIPPLDAADNIE